MRMVAQGMDAWPLVELGGSSAQTAQRDLSGRFWFTHGIAHEPGRPVALACPGVVRDGRVLYATSLGWPDDANPAQELGLGRIQCVANDAVAAALGESVLRGGGSPNLDLVYVSLGTGVGSAQVTHGTASYLHIGHRQIGGRTYCEGCRGVGCLNSELSARRLPALLSNDDVERVAGILAGALRAAVPGERTPIILGGGITRRYPAIATAVGRLMANQVDVTVAPVEAKSAAYAGLDYLARSCPVP